MLNEFSRTELLLGKEAMQKIRKNKIAIFGIGGVGSFAVEALARAGVEKFVLVDNDVICITNINRQLHATIKTVGKSKVDVMKERILDINPKAEVETYQEFYLPENSDELLKKDYDYIIDAVDTVTAKIDLVVKATKFNIPIISSMGAGNKLNPTRFEVSDIYKTSVCPLAKVMRKELRKREIKNLKVVFSKEEPILEKETQDLNYNSDCTCQKVTFRQFENKAHVPGSISFVPSVVGLIIAGEVIKELIAH